MEKNDNDNKDKISLIIVILIIVVAICILLYSIFSSNKNLKNNTQEETKKDPNTVEIYDRTSTLTEEEINEMTIDENKQEEINQSKKEPVETEIASFTSTLYDKDQNRVDNITLAISKINGKIVKPNEEFSFNNTVGPMDEEHGFKKAVGFDSEGRKIQIPGGGMCQISSTMYNAVLMANLEVTERHPHSRRVYYVPKDKDATIYYGSLDFKFKNNTQDDIKIEATNDNQNVTIKLKKIS